MRDAPLAASQSLAASVTEMVTSLLLRLRRCWISCRRRSMISRDCSAPSLRERVNFFPTFDEDTDAPVEDGHGVKTAEEFGQEGGTDRFLDLRLDDGRDGPIRSGVDVRRADVGGEDDDSRLEVDFSPLTVGEMTCIEDLHASELCRRAETEKRT